MAFLKRNFKIHTCVASDSQARGFDRKPQPYSNLYNDIIYVIEKGARVDRIEGATFRALKDVSKSDVLVMYIACGISKLTFREYHEGGVESVPHQNQKLLENL